MERSARPALRRVLVVDDDPALTRVLADGLRRRGFEVVRCGGAAEALDQLHDPNLEAVVTDLRMPGRSGTDLCREIATARPDLPVLVITAFGSLDTAIEVLRAGAYDLLVKPVDLDLLAHALTRATSNRALRMELARLRESTPASLATTMIGRSTAMREVFDLVERVANTTINVHITGEAGTGRQRLARTLHESSRRREKPFLTLDCAAGDEAWVERELFGATDERGLLVRADGGTLVINEPGELSAAAQAKLLRALQERSVRTPSDERSVPFDTRVVVLTRSDLDPDDPRLREDLRLLVAVVTIAIPPLRSRDTDVLLLAQQFVRSAAARHGRAVSGITPQAAARFLAYPWPGNVRELETCIERAVVVARYTSLTIEDLPERVREHVPVTGALVGVGELVPLAEIERRYVRYVLAATGGNKSVAARILGVDRKTLSRRLEPGA